MANPGLDEVKPNSRPGTAAAAGEEELKKTFPNASGTNLLRADESSRGGPRFPELSLPGSSFGRVRQGPHQALVNRAAGRLGHPASIPRAIMSRSPEALALGPAVISFRCRYHCPSFGCLLNRSRDCTRSRVPPLSRRRYADPPAGASICCLRFAPAQFSDSLQDRAVGCAEAPLRRSSPFGLPFLTQRPPRGRESRFPKSTRHHGR
jgi:hypothetical protein